MTVCIDTNVVLGMFTASHAYRPIFEEWFCGRLQWAVSTEILLEYEEIMQRKASPQKADAMMQIITLVALRHGNIVFSSPSFRFHLIAADPDDDKFADCAVAAEADFVVTEDAHFDVLRGSGHKPQPIAPAEFIARLGDGG